MINLIENTDFESSVYKVFAAGEHSTEFLNEIITEVQEKTLRKILGNIEYAAFESDFSDGELQSDKWKEFVNGKTYSVNGITYDYKGIKPVLKNLVYYFWQKHTISVLAESGELNLKEENAVRVVPYKKMIDAYNSAVDMIQSNNPYYPSVYHFLVNNDFPDLIFTRFEKQNMFGI